MFPDPTIGATGGSNNAELFKKPNSDDENQTQDQNSEKIKNINSIVAFDNFLFSSLFEKPIVSPSTSLMESLPNTLVP